MSETQNPHGEFLRTRVEYLVQTLGYHETEDMTELRHEAVAEMVNRTDRGRALTIHYASQGELVIEQRLDREAKSCASIGFNITRALMYHDAGRTAEYVEYLNDILEDLDNLINSGFKEWIVTVMVLERAIDDAHATDYPH